METNPSIPPKSKLVRFVARPLILVIGTIALCVTAYQLVMNLAFNAKLHAESPIDHVVQPIVHLVAVVFFLMLVLSALRRTKWFNRFWQSLFTWRTARRALVGLAIFATLTAVFYAEENWRGKRAWERCKRDLEAKGAVLDWSALIPPPVPDDQNVFKAPKMAEWFMKDPPRSSPGNLASNPTDLSKRLTGNPATAHFGASSLLTNVSSATEYLKWGEQLEGDFSLIREALKRPYARMDGDYTIPFEIPIPNFVTMRNFAQVLAQRARCDWLLGQPEKALNELALLNDSRRLLEGAPTGKPMPLVSAMINVAVTGLYAQTIADGMRLQAWREPQLTAIQEQLKKIDLPSLMVAAFEAEPAAVCRTLEITPPGQFILFHEAPKLWEKFKDPKYFLRAAMPRGWIYQNMAVVASLERKVMDGFDPARQIVQPQKLRDAGREIETTIHRFSPYTILARVWIPNFARAWQTTAQNQTKVNQANIVCGLERYRLAHGDYPEMLDALVPKFVQKLPRDIIGGQPLHYSRSPDGKFVLYSVGWNETDDGGETVLAGNGGQEIQKGDWVWPIPGK